MFHNAHGCAALAVCIKRNAFLAIFTWIELIFLNFKISKCSYQACVLHLISLMKVKLYLYISIYIYIYLNSWLKNASLNIGSNGTHSVLDTPDLRVNIVVYVTVEFPISSDKINFAVLLVNFWMHISTWYLNKSYSKEFILRLWQRYMKTEIML